MVSLHKKAVLVKVEVKIFSSFDLRATETHSFPQLQRKLGSILNRLDFEVERSEVDDFVM